MVQPENASSLGFVSSVKNVFFFYFLMGRKTRRTKVFYFISLIPMMIAAFAKFAELVLQSHHLEGIYIFSNIIVAFYLQFLVLILALFFGTSICSEEVEGKTLTYLTTRPVPKAALLLGKYAAYTLLIVIMMAVGVVMSFLILNAEGLTDPARWSILFRDLGVLTLGLVCYTAFFTFIGTFLKRSILFGLIFSFGWENVIQYFPGSTQRFVIAHYIKSLLPSPTTGRFSFLLFQLEPTPPGTAVVVLLVLTAVFLALACLIFTKKEYILED
ncbi:MAG: ABC transporter permease [Candidatus Aminicenantes bacterium]|nr:ABC transporter permease [Candidatus Aminicenantes bacterium]